jgi:hypothetical protein
VFGAVGGFEKRARRVFEDQSFPMKVFLRYPIYIPSHVWILYRARNASACAQTSPSAYLRVRGDFLDCLKERFIGSAKPASA